MFPFVEEKIKPNWLNDQEEATWPQPVPLLVHDHRIIESKTPACSSTWMCNKLIRRADACHLSEPRPRSPTENTTAAAAQHLVIYKDNCISNSLPVTCRRQITSGQGTLSDRRHITSLIKTPGTRGDSSDESQRSRLQETVAPKEYVAK